MLKIQFKDRRKPALWLVDSTLKIGSTVGCEIVIDEPTVDAVHVELVIQQDDILLRNISKNRSVFVNEIPVVSEQQLSPWDVIRVGQSELEIIDPLNDRNPPPVNKPEHATVIRPAVSQWMLKAMSAPLDGQYFSLANGFLIGRDESCDIKLPFSYISRNHVKLALRKDKLYVEDLNSANGTYVNGDKIKSCELRNEDELRLDEFVFHVIGPVSKVENKPRTIVREKLGTATSSKNHQPIEMQQQKLTASQKVFLHGLSSGVEGKIYEISNIRNHISRMLGHHLSTSEKSVSARHVYLTELDLGWEIKNDGASDGLLVNGKMQSRVILQDGDELIVGGTLLKFQSVGDQPLNYAKPMIKPSSKSKPIIWIMVVLAIAAGVIFLVF